MISEASRTAGGIDMIKAAIPSAAQGTPIAGIDLALNQGVALRAVEQQRFIFWFSYRAFRRIASPHSKRQYGHAALLIGGARCFMADDDSKAYLPSDISSQ